MIEKTHSLLVAETVLNAVKVELNRSGIESEDLVGFRFESYSNGREQGYYLGGRLLGIAFSEYRNSDQIVIYVGTLTDFTMKGNSPSDKVYESKTFFRVGDYGGAAEFIVDVIRHELSQQKESHD